MDSGSIDKVSKIFEEEIDIPSTCWWRDDLSRRLENALQLKWAYPELMTGTDLLHYLVESGLSEDKNRRISTIKAFLRDQYSIDEEVRFKQVELQNKLLDLFTDVPIAIRGIQTNHNLHHLYYLIKRDLIRQPIEHDESEWNAFMNVTSREEKTPLGAAEMLLHPLAQERLARIVLEGAPGQGKSTITQYICQVHRMRLLQKGKDLEAIPERHKLVSCRIPFKVDLRDFATWLGRKDPFSPEEANTIPHHWHKSLESFLAALVRHHSGGVEFSVADLHAVAKLSSILLVFDGLDEVADISKRQEVVEEIVKGINRLEENSVSLQVIVTSRPAAFANSPGLPSNIFPYCQLESLTRPLIDEYAGKWLVARRLYGRETTEFKRILKEKLDQPHLRDLAKNPMQLAILLSLIHNRGPSLPDKRTELYDSYIELFFSREAQKSSVVREHRDLLVNIHRYLAWVLHSEAEQGRHRGSISTERLQQLLSQYLTQEGYDPSISRKLFTGMVERVVALVSRVEGTYEFEVQPLREYFAARYLYETAPYSPPGSPRRGNILDRFDAIVRDFYWLNVTRFNAGCFSIGELPSLVDRLEELTKEEGYRNTNHPRVLAATLLSDWVFTQHPKSMRQVVALVVDGLGLRFLLTSQNHRFGSGAPLVLPKECGRSNLLDRCFDILRAAPARDYSLQIVELISANSSPDELIDLWYQEVISKEGIERTRWLEYGLHLGLLTQLPVTDLDRINAKSPLDPDDFALLFRAKRWDFFEHSEQKFRAAIDCILNAHVAVYSFRRIESILDLFGNIMNVYRYALALKSRQPIKLNEIWAKSSTRMSSINKEDIKVWPDYQDLESCMEVSEIAIQESNRTAAEWATDLTPWDNIVEKSRTIWGEQWVHFHIANVASGIKSTRETCTDFPDLLDHSKSLCRRARYARLRAGSAYWWTNQFELAKNESDLMFVSLLLLTWGSQRTLLSTSEIVSSALDRLSPYNWKRLIRSLQQALSLTREQMKDNLLALSVDELPDRLSERTVTAFGTRALKENSKDIYLKYLLQYEGEDPFVLEFSQDIALEVLLTNPQNWRPHLNMIRKSYAAGVLSERYAFKRYLRHGDATQFNLSIAKEITKNSDSYPSDIVAFAEERCRQAVALSITPVAQIADRDGWFN